MKRENLLTALEALGVDSKSLVYVHIDFGSDKHHSHGTIEYQHIDRDASQEGGVVRNTHSEGITP